MNRFLYNIASLVFISLLFSANTNAQESGTRYMLPSTAIDVYVTIEKTVYEPGQFCEYSEPFLKKSNVKNKAYTEYKITGIRFNAVGVPDSSKTFNIVANAKNNINKVSLSDFGTILAINAKPIKEKQFPKFKSSPARELPNPNAYLTQDILATGNKIKMAELVVDEICDIRENRDLLTRGQSESMPKDGEQLKVMLQELDRQQEALTSMFVGTIVKDTTETVFRCIPSGDVKDHIIFRFSKHYGLTDVEDLSGEPYYINVKDLHTVTEKDIDAKTLKRTVVFTNLPSKIEVTLSDGKNNELGSYELYAGQYGTLNPLTEDLFNKRVITSVVLNPVTGSLDKIDTKLYE